mmetsp:Transcript_15325/g.24959  ORF Transcript_15325/g.24959 Transcript_15325/m.24959 type:complete len:440 (-) Transcript_15325:563-1882(-)|eukprot:CAMPEP_0203756738 /NCGR_PEP_ID=MMETSP0098-20131031/9951_1 /ASSEMBLY_ACC=CAM_ASM_000208 /TAXON_ID=96639 /ORGANISM=" , Strain NY0313808BC1" /LENGTH=439 /DNA_ID=CAMNT_0050648719 /DNA_START=318 /DNA_END=1637 /DNA_ORIENTATION=-
MSSSGAAPAPLTRQLTSHLDTFADDPDDTNKNPDALGVGDSNATGCVNANLQFLIGEATDIGGGSVNQDKCMVVRNGSNIVLAVFDGHGRELGELAAIVAREKMRTLFENPAILEQIATSPEDTLQRIFELAHLEIKERFHEKYRRMNWEVEEAEEGYLVKRRGLSGSWSCTHGGTTATVVVIFGETNRMIVANVGDSTALWGGKDQHGNLVYEELSAEHSPESESEFRRVRSFHPDRNSRMPAMRFVYDSPSFSKNQCPAIFQVDPHDQEKLTITGMGNYYKNVRNEWATLVTTPPGARFQDALAFTRSLGDLHLHVYGVISTPEVREYNISDLHKQGKHGPMGTSFLLVCTDGVWDNWKFRDITEETLSHDHIDLAHKHKNSYASCQNLMDKNLTLARQHFGSQADNMTAILCYVNAEESGKTGAVFSPSPPPTPPS